MLSVASWTTQPISSVQNSIHQSLHGHFCNPCLSGKQNKIRLLPFFKAVTPFRVCWTIHVQWQHTQREQDFMQNSIWTCKFHCFSRNNCICSTDNKQLWHTHIFYTSQRIIYKKCPAVKALKCKNAEILVSSTTTKSSCKSTQEERVMNVTWRQDRDATWSIVFRHLKTCKGDLIVGGRMLSSFT